MKKQSQIQEYLKNLVNITSGTQKEYYQWILDVGMDFSNFNRATDLEGWKGQIYPKQCYRNSQLVSAASYQVDYVEGFYVTEIIPLPLEHAWNVEGREIFDTTSILGQFNVKEYFGVQISSEFVKEYINIANDTSMTLLQWFYLNYAKDKEWICYHVGDGVFEIDLFDNQKDYVLKGSYVDCVKMMHKENSKW